MESDEPTIGELSDALDSLASAKAPGKDGIPSEVLECCKETIMDKFHEILCLCWREGKVPHDIRHANIVRLYKNKGDRCDCNTYHEIFLLSVVGKLFVQFELRESIQNRSAIFEPTDPPLIKYSPFDSYKKSAENKKATLRSIYRSFEGLRFDQQGWPRQDPSQGVHQGLLSIIRPFQEEMKGTVFFDGLSSDSLDIRSRVKQGCILATTLFGSIFTVLVKHASGSVTEGIYLRTRSDGKISNLARLNTKSKVQLRCPLDSLFADDF